MRTLHPGLKCPLCGLPFEHIHGTPVQLVLEGVFPQHLADKLRPGRNGEVEFVACQHGRAKDGPAFGLVPPHPISEEEARAAIGRDLLRKAPEGQVI